VPHRPATKTDQSQDAAGQLATNDTPQSIYPDNREQVQNTFPHELLIVFVVQFCIIRFTKFGCNLFGKQYQMSSDFAMVVSIVIVDVTPTADMVAFSLERLRKYDATPNNWDSRRRWVSSRTNRFQLGQIYVIRFFGTLLIPGRIPSCGNCVSIQTIMLEVFETE
jgi:hypothetical protein